MPKSVLLQAVAFSHAETQARQDGTQKILNSDSADAQREGAGADIVTAEGGRRLPGRRIHTGRSGRGTLLMKG